jgi:hypothetical protein
MDTQLILQIVEKLGIPMGVLMVFSWGFWKSAQWAGTRIILPIHERHMQFLDSLEDTLKTLAGGQDQLAKELSTLTALISREMQKPK